VVHDLPADLKKALSSNAKALETWEDITPLARNEWICWIESAKKNGNKNAPDRMGLFQPQRRKAQTLLLARLSASLRSSRRKSLKIAAIGFCQSDWLRPSTLAEFGVAPSGQHFDRRLIGCD
jgi:hypothetical protein